MSALPTIPVVVIGGGPGGLALAQGLVRAGIGVRVFERSAARDDYVQGFRLRIRSRGLDTLRDNLPPHLWQAFTDTLGRAPATGLTVDQDLRALADLVPDRDDDTHAEKSVSRITLRQVLLSGLEEVVVTGRRFTDYVPDGDGVIARFDDGSAVRAGILVGADGAGSRVRGQLVPDASGIDTGIRRIAGKMTLAAAAHHAIPPLLLDNTVSVRPAQGRTLMITSHRVDAAAFARHGLIGQDDPSHAHLGGFHFDNTTSYVWWNTAYRQGELGPDAALAGLDGAGLIDLVLSQIPDWHPGLQALIRHSDPSTVALLHVRSSVPGKDWAPGRVTLLGDAAHQMTYFRALGANTALYDAGLLTRALVAIHRDGAPVADRIGAYETAMRAHGYEAVRSSLAAMLRTIQPLPDPSLAAE